MGNSSSSGGAAPEAPVVCLDCDKKHQKDLPASDPVSQPGRPCAEVYDCVAACMTKNGGRVSSCTSEWEVFRECHQNEQQRPQQ